MRYFYILLALLGVSAPCFAQEESRLFISPGRETFFHFPSKIMGNQYSLRVYLPEEEQVKAQKYPVIYVIGLAQEAREEIKNYLAHQSALVVWMDFKDGDLAQETDRIVTFFSRELVPYIDVNYFTFDGPEKRVVYALGENAANVAVRLLEKPNLFNYVVLNHPGQAAQQWQVFPANGRAIITGNQSELSFSQRRMETLGAQFATQFVLHYAVADAPLLSDVDLAYLFGPKEELTPVKFHVFLSEEKMPLQAGAFVYLQVAAELKNKMVSSFVPENLRIAPPFLSWDEQSGKLTLLSGAEKGKIKISALSEQTPFKASLKVKKH